MAEVAARAHLEHYPTGLSSEPSTSQTDDAPASLPSVGITQQEQTALLAWQDSMSDHTRRPGASSMRIDIPQSTALSSHKRGPSVLPNFTFNASDTSGRHDSATPPQTPEEPVAMTPSRGGHRRGGSEFVGGDSRLGLSGAVSSSPVKSGSIGVGGFSSGSTSGRRGHAHRRSAAISSHDVGKLMQSPGDGQSRLSSSLPSTPLEYPSTGTSQAFHAPPVGILDPFGPPLEIVETAPARPPSRPRVGFSDNVEFIPRPLSTISSETESSLSTVRGHSVNNSISSVLSLSTPSPPATRISRIPLRTHSEDDVLPATSASPAKHRKVEQEGHWLKRRSSENLKRPMSESAVNPPRTTFVDPEPISRSRKRSVSHALGFDRRKSEPSLGLSANEQSRLSTISLQEPGTYSQANAPVSHDSERKSSARRVKDWAVAKIVKRSKDGHRTVTASSSSSSLRPVSAGSFLAPERRDSAPPVAETDLDAVLGTDVQDASNQWNVQSKPRLEVDTSAFTLQSSWRSDCRSSDDDTNPDTMLDLDAALGPFKTPPIGSHRPRKEMHSSRLNKDFSGPGGHYHRRAESAPNLSPFEHVQDGNAQQPDMADVFEEDEEDASTAPDASELGATGRALGAEAGTQGDHSGLVDMATAVPRHGLGIHEDAELEQNPALYGHSSSVQSSVAFEGRGTSIIEETIPEEVTPVYDVEIVQAHEEPRASSLTKSSDSSDTPTLLAPPISVLSYASNTRSPMLPDSYPTPPTFSSPSIRPGSLSSSTTGEHAQDLRFSVEVPSLTSSRSTMLSVMHGNGSRRDIASGGDPERSASVTPNPTTQPTATDMRRKRGSIQSLSQLMPFSSKSRVPSADARPQTAADAVNVEAGSEAGSRRASAAPLGAARAAVKKENRLKKLMFWKTKHHAS